MSHWFPRRVRDNIVQPERLRLASALCFQPYILIMQMAALILIGIAKGLGSPMSVGLSPTAPGAFALSSTFRYAVWARRQCSADCSRLSFLAWTKFGLRPESKSQEQGGWMQLRRQSCSLLHLHSIAGLRGRDRFGLKGGSDRIAWKMYHEIAPYLQRRLEAHASWSHIS
jgi:hypothetical protein